MANNEAFNETKEVSVGGEIGGKRVVGRWRVIQIECREQRCRKVPLYS
jgi:hypothetical protein